MPQRIRAGCDLPQAFRLRHLHPLPQRIRAGCDLIHKLNRIILKLCLSAFARVATCTPHIHYLRLPFASAHSRGLRLQALHHQFPILPLPQRIRAGCDGVTAVYTVTTGPLPQRIRAGCDTYACQKCIIKASLPQRIRAGCDEFVAIRRGKVELCHSAFVRVATLLFGLCMHERFLCHSAFVRVATRTSMRASWKPRSLPQRIRAGCDEAGDIIDIQAHALPQRIRAGCDRSGLFRHDIIQTLPQRIRAGCDCGKAMQRTANLLREGR